MFSYSKLSSALGQSNLPLVKGRHAAVAIVLDEKKRVFMIQRARHEKDPWSGHMGFPGGGYEPGDEGLQQTAERECREEVGFDLELHGELLGSLHRLSHPKITVDAFVYRLISPVSISINEEVEAYFWISLHDLDNDRFTDTIEHVFQGAPREFPAIVLPEIPVPIWGISLGFIHQALRIWSSPS